LFHINGARLENQLVEWAGGISVNKELPPGGRPGRSLSVEQFNSLKADIILISAFISNSIQDFQAECRLLGMKAKALDNGRVHTHPVPGWDFGSPRWILGLMNMANLFHPDRFSFEVMAEAEAFYHRFYGVKFSPNEVNRSFAKPSQSWCWAGQSESPNRQ
jgi:hypothetical protein